jgi:hypothetical protein
MNLTKFGRRSNLKIEVFYESLLSSSLDTSMGSAIVPLHEIYDGVCYILFVIFICYIIEYVISYISYIMKYYLSYLFIGLLSYLLSIMIPSI